MKFTKMHGLGNDYIYINGFQEKVLDPVELARRVSNRNFGVGADGLILIQPPTSEDADCRMEMYNADGSRAEMCGNGIRCVGKYVHDRALVTGERIRVETDAGLRVIEVHPSSNGANETLLTVDMGPPLLAQEDIPATLTDDPEASVIEAPLEVPDLGLVTVTLVSTGNPHCVVRLGPRQPLPRTVKELSLEKIGPLFENHQAFPERINTEFIEVLGSSEVNFRVWERGSGETLACGTGACASVVAGVVGGWLDRQVVVHLAGGDLKIRWDDDTSPVYMTGPATEVFTAEFHPSWINT